MGSTFKIVAIGASNGGNVALRHILSHLSANFPAPIVYLNSYHSADPAWLAQDLALPARWAQAGEVLATGTVYICPGGFSCQVQPDGTLQLIRIHADHSTKARVDPFFQSVADAYGSHAVALVLSGEGSDGAAGILALHAQRGFVLVQEPASALHPSLPDAAVVTGAVDHLLATGAIAPFLNRLAQT